MAVVLTMIASLIVALTIIPFLASRMLPRHESAEGNWLLQAVMRGIHRFYRPLLHFALARPKTTVAASLALFAASLTLVPVVGFSLFPKADTPQFLITITAPNGASVAETDRALRFVEDELKQHEEIEFWFSNLGKGNPKVYYNIIPAEQSSNLAEVYAQVKHYDPDSTPAFIDGLRAKLREYPNARIVVKEFENGPPIDAPIAIRVLGSDLDVLKRLSARGRRHHQGGAGLARCRQSAEARPHRPQAAAGRREGRAAGRAERRVRPRSAPGGQRRGCRRLPRARWRELRHRGAHADRRAAHAGATGPGARAGA
jgi:multidrug efflux pump subunit AcrB